MNKSSTLNFLMGKSASNKSFILRRVSACTDSEMDRAEMLAALNSHFQFKKGFDSELAEHYDENVCLDPSKEDCEAPNGNFQNNCRHICKYCQREFSSGRALGGHMRAHTSLQSHVNPWNCSLDDVADKQLQVSSSCGQSSNLHSGCEMKYGSSSHQADTSLSSSFYDQLSKRDKFLSTRSGANIDKERSYAMDTEDEASVIKAPSQSLEMNNSEMEGGAADGFVHASNYHDNIFENDEMLVKNRRFPPLYTLRRNPKPSKRLVEVVASASASDSMRILSLRDGVDVHACTECGKEFGSWKGLFGHMRCHPE